MKAIVRKTLSVAIATICINIAYGQFNTAPSVGDRWAQTNDPGGTNNDIRRAGIGNFSNFGTAPSAAFHINENFLTDLNPTATNYYLPGEVFRTTGPSANINTWRMFTGAGNGTEKFSITIPANSNEVLLNAFQATGTMNFLTANTQHMTIRVNGTVGIGPNFTAPMSLLHINSGKVAYLQATNATTGQTSGDGLKFGVDINGLAEVRQQENLALNFFTSNTQRVNVSANGNVGIGTNFTTPNNLLDVSGGDIDINTPLRGYMIGDNYVLRHKGFTTCIFVGVGAGAANLAAATDNTFVGRDAGVLNTTGSPNTFIGAYAGQNNTIGTHNTFIGDASGAADVTGNRNTFVGHHAGANYITGNDNIAIGSHAVFNGIPTISTGNRNTIIGNNTLRDLTTGDDNTVLGFQAGNNTTTGDNNIFIGSNANASQPDLQNAIAIGAIAIVTANDKMILGNNSNWVGIGLSNDQTANSGPQNSLEIMARTIGTGAPILDKSGLRFRQLTSASPATTGTPAHTGNGKLLTVTELGDVVLVNATGVTGATGATGANGINGTNGTDGINGATGAAGSAVSANNGLTINPTGNVQLGQVYGSNFGALLHNTEIPFSGNDLFLNGVGLPGGQRFIIGQLPVSTSVKSYLFDDTETNGFFSELSANNIPLEVLSNGARVRSAIHGKGYSNNGSTGTVVGVLGESMSDFNATGVAGYASGTADNVIGVHALVDGTGNYNTGGYFIARGAAMIENFGISVIASGAPINYGVYSSVTTAGTPGSGSPGGPDYAGYFNGDVLINGTFGSPSDINLKQNINAITSALGIINQLQPKIFDYKHSDYPGLNLPQGLQYGLIAQDVEPILPDLVTNNNQPALIDSLGNIAIPAVVFKGLEYQQLIPILIKGMQEQQQQISSKDSILTSLQNQLNQLMSTVTECCNNHDNGNHNGNHSMSTKTNVELKDEQTIVLEQNVPNPFAEQTSITYFLPEDANKAQMLFYNASGKLIQSVDLTQKGKGSLTVFASDLTNGIYTYTLVVDGKIMETKKMLKQK